ncbi:hypothetical protein JMJ77_0004445 [Colletotrichum scovillei]|uniref:Uncharacterized protein n=1 Tax=Colletotrichum scovillei TaxID=1209932 RepID=A0A9P7QXI7_9PEZI|nr:hypothetical protein JMJ77_0004445 [Colletotrichum scovillei]KAG7049703.1 hypothetical protein JMJ78_0013682 [Colletotrichum scovillei]KAG7064441.1 hypothetical protein JMJ76_0007485 [Colletotrichum scovillei]
MIYPVHRHIPFRLRGVHDPRTLDAGVDSGWRGLERHGKKRGYQGVKVGRVADGWPRRRGSSLNYVSLVWFLVSSFDLVPGYAALAPSGVSSIPIPVALITLTVYPSYKPAGVFT